MNYRMNYRRAVLLLSLLLPLFAPARAQEPEPAPARDERLERVLERAGEAVARYQSGLFSITFAETLRDEELNKEMAPKKSREFVFETVVLREPLSDNEEDFYPKSLRRLKTVDGKPAPKGRRVPWYGYNVQSLGLLLPKHRKLHEFTLEGEESLGGRKTYRVRAVRPGQPPPSVEWDRRLMGMAMRFRFRVPTYLLVWIDAENFDVLRLESRLVAPFEFDSPRTFGAFGPSRHLKLTNLDSVVTFRRQTFKEPEQVLLVPDSAEWLTVIEGARRPRLRASIRFTDYHRFRSDVKIIEEETNGQ